MRSRQKFRKYNGMIQARYHELAEPGRDAPLHYLCSIEDAEYKITAHGRKRRTEAEYSNYLTTLYNQKLTELRTKKEAVPPLPKSPMIREIMQQWLDEVAANNSPATASHYLRAINYYIEAIGNHRLSEFKREYKLQLLTYLKGREISVESQRTYIVELQRFFNWCAEEELIEDAPRLKKPKRIPQKKPVLYTYVQLNQLESYLRHKIETTMHSYQQQCYRNHLRVLIVARETAMRSGEIWSLLLSRIDLDNRLIKLRANSEIGWNIKNDEEADIPISPALERFLREDFEKRVENERWLLDDGKGKLLYSSAGKLTKAFERQWERLGIVGEGMPKPLHGIRATVLTWITERYGVSVARALARHKNIHTTETHYVNIDSRLLGEAVATISNRNESEMILFHKK